MKRKFCYISPTIELIELDSADIITSSSGGNDVDIDPGLNDGEWL